MTRTPDESSMSARSTTWRRWEAISELGDPDVVLRQAAADRRRANHSSEVAPMGWYRYSSSANRLKRLLDVTISASLLAIAAPLFAVLALAIRLTSPGPAFFHQVRMGFAEQPFVVWKFRTMATDNDNEIHRKYVTAQLRGEISTSPDGTFKLTSDPRVTPLGRWLRRTSLDELPQLYNVLRGEMSLVGPRPSLPYEVEYYSADHRFRALSMPGLTGLWQVEGRNELSMLDALDIDLDYVTSCSLRGDLAILAKTFRVVFSGF